MVSLTLCTLISFSLSFFAIIYLKKLCLCSVEACKYRLLRELIFNFSPRIGGVLIFATLIIVVILRMVYAPDSAMFHSGYFLAACLPAFLVGLVEDITKKCNDYLKYSGLILSSLLFVYFLSVGISRLDIYLIDTLLKLPLLGIMLACLTLISLSGAYEILDASSNLPSITGILSLLAISLVGHFCNDHVVFMNAALLIGALIGFSALNYRRQFIHMGKSGSFLMGLLIGSLSLLLIQRNQSVSPWFFFTVNLYAVLRALFISGHLKIHKKNLLSRINGLIFERCDSLWLKLRQNIYLKSSAKSNQPLFKAPLSMALIFVSILFWDKTHILALATLITIILSIFMRLENRRF